MLIRHIPAYQRRMGETTHPSGNPVNDDSDMIPAYKVSEGKDLHL
jgi:hypothetical protein